MLPSLRFFLVFLAYIVKDSAQIQNVKLILPTAVQAGTSATLLCLYDLQGASLYSVQWYRGQFEFFRFVPKETPSIKVFHIPGIYVDTFASNDHQVTLRNIPAQISGEFSCEITTDAPPFKTSCVSKNLTVIDFNLSLEISKRQYHFGDMIDANCTLIPKFPSAKFIFYWNAQPISEITENEVSKSAHLRFNTATHDINQTLPVWIPLKCTAILNELKHTISRTISLKLKPNPAAKASQSSDSVCFPLMITLMLGLIK